MKNPEFLVLQKTEHSQFCRDTFRAKKGFSIVHNNWFLANKLIKQSYSSEHEERAAFLLNKFKGYLKQGKLKCTQFYFGHDEKNNKYIYSYTIRSQIHNNQDLKIDGYFDENSIIFVMFPQMFAKFLGDVLSQVPMLQLMAVARGD